MRKTASLYRFGALIAACALVPKTAAAQCGGYVPQQGGLIGGLIGSMVAQQQATACAQQRYQAQQQAQMQAEANRQAFEQQRAAAQAQQQAAAAQVEAQRAQAAERNRKIAAERIREQQIAAEKAKAEADQRKAAMDAQRQADEEKAKLVAAEAEQSRARLIEAQKVAETSPDNHCKEPSFAKVVMENFNKFKIMHRLDTQVIDIEHITTDRFDTQTTAMVCHGTFLLDSGAELPGSFEIRKNVAGDLIYLWTPDAADGGAAHVDALKSGPGRDIQMLNGNGNSAAPRTMVVIPAKSTP